MHFTYVETGDNFQPDIVTDPFRRIPIKYGVMLSEDESIEDAEKMIQERIKNFIQKNTVVTHTHIEYKNIDVPYMKEEKSDYQEQTLEEQIMSCEEIKVLESYKFIAKKDPILQLAYDKKMYILKELSPKK